MHTIIGRAAEKKLLNKLYDSNQAEFLAVYGRRRIGKTYLISQFFKDRGIYFEITGNKDANRGEQLKNFQKEFIALFKPEGSYKPLKTWGDAFHLLKESLLLIPTTQKVVLFFDELPWLSSRKSGFMQALDYFWNRHASRMPNVLLIICGSAASWMIKKVIQNRGGLYGRLSAEIRLQAFTLSEVEGYFLSRQINLTRKQITEIYMATGGVPKYLSFVERGKSSAQNINALCFQPQSPLLKEFHKLYESLFEDAYKHIKIVKTLANMRQGMTQNEIFTATGLAPGGSSVDILVELEEAGFILSMQAYGKSKRDKKYRLVDEYSLFYLTWIENNKISVLQGTDKNYWEKIQGSPPWHTWSGYAFENICLQHALKIKEGLEIGGVSTREWYWRFLPGKNSDEQGAEIDLVIERADQCINLCEIKFYNMEYAMTQKDAEDLERKKIIFAAQTKTRKAVFVTLITPYGLKENQYYLASVDNQLTLDALF